MYYLGIYSYVNKDIIFYLFFIIIKIILKIYVVVDLCLYFGIEYIILLKCLNLFKLLLCLVLWFFFI